MKVIVENERVVSEFLGFNVKLHEDLVQNPKCKNFIEENMDYLISVEAKDFIDFFKRTGIILEHRFNNWTVFNFLGLKKEYENRIYNSHLLVFDEENDINIKDNILYINGKEIRNIKDEVQEQQNRFEKFKEINERLLHVSEHPGVYDDFDIEKRDLIQYSDEYFPNYKTIDGAEQLVITPYNDVFTLTEDGILYCNNEVYDKNVEHIFEQDTINKIIIYSNKNVEYLTASFGGPLNIRCDKVLYSKTCLATLKDKKLRIIHKEYDDYIKNKSYDITLYGIDDIEFKTWDNDELLLKVGKEEITIPVF